MSFDIIGQHYGIPSMNDDEIENVRALESAIGQRDQLSFVTEHQFHAGVYARTIRVAAGVALAGVLVKIPTTIIVSGDVIIYTGAHMNRLTGHSVIPASANTKRAFYAETDAAITMLFHTDATTVEEAEREFTDEAHLLASHTNENVVVISGE